MGEHRQAKGNVYVCAVEEGAWVGGTVLDKGKREFRAQMWEGAQPMRTRESQASDI